MKPTEIKSKKPRSCYLRCVIQRDNFTCTLCFAGDVSRHRGRWGVRVITTWVCIKQNHSYTVSLTQNTQRRTGPENFSTFNTLSSCLVLCKLSNFWTVDCTWFAQMIDAGPHKAFLFFRRRTVFFILFRISLHSDSNCYLFVILLLCTLETQVEIVCHSK